MDWGLGPISARVAVANEVSVSFKTELSEASRILESRLGELRMALTRAGLTPGRLTAQAGTLPCLPRQTPTMPLLDERA